MSGKGSQNKAMVDKLLTNVSNGYFPTGFVCEKVLTPLPVIQNSGILPAYGNGHLRILNSRLSGRGRARFANPIERVIDKKYFIEEHGLQGEVTENDYANVEQPYDAEKDETLGLTSLIAVEKEYKLAATLTDTNIITQNTTLLGNAKFSNTSSSDPVGVIKTAQKAVFSGCGKKANSVVIPWQVYNDLKYHPQILQNLGFAQNRAGTLSIEEIAKFFDIEASRVFIPDALYNAAKEGQPDSMLPIWGNSIVLYHAATKVEKQQVSLGYYPFTKGGSRRVKKWNIEDTFGNTGILVGDQYSFEIVNTGAAYLIKDAI